MYTSRLIFVVLLASIGAFGRDSKAVFDLLKKGHELSAAEAAKLGGSIKGKPNDEEAQIELLSYYSLPPVGSDLTAIKRMRAAHIFWLIEHDPKDGWGLFDVVTGVYRLHCAGDDLADPEAFEAASAIWLKRLADNPEDAGLRRTVSSLYRVLLAGKGEQVLIGAQDQAGLGRLYSYAVLGVTGESYLNSDPVGTDAALRQRPFAEKARTALEAGSDRDFVSAAAITLLREGAILWADGHLDWDYTPLGNRLLARALSGDPDNMTLPTLRTTLPARGERPPLTIRVGGNVESSNLIRQVPLAYPEAARKQRISGTVDMTALIGLDGKVMRLTVNSGPPELVAASLEAVRQWEYKPTNLNGKPCFVITKIDVNFVLSPR